MAGHLFIVNGDLTKIACDAILIPTDAAFTITRSWRALLADRTLPKRWTRGNVLPLDHVKQEPRIWLGNIGQPGDNSKYEVFEPTIREFVEKASSAVRSVDDSDRIYPWPKHRIALNVVGSGYGGGSQKKGDLLRGLVSTLQELAGKCDIDILLITRGEKSYAAAQRARHQVVGDGNLTQIWRFSDIASHDLASEARKIASAAIESQLVLFIGAGVSAGAGLPTWHGLMAEMALEAGMSPDVMTLLKTKDLRDQATLIERQLKITDIQLRNLVVTNLSGKTRYSLQHALLASLPSREAITTNFDKLFEEASRTDDKDIAVLPDDPSQTGGRWLLKLHGSLDDPERMVLTRSDYLEMPRRYGALIGLVQGLLLMRHMMFVGYSLSDEDFHELIHEVRAARGGSNDGARGTVLTLFDDGLERQLWEDDLHVVSMTRLPPDQKGKGTRTEAARQLEVFLDLVGFLSTTSAAFFLDPTYDSLSDDEADLRDALTNLVQATDGAQFDSVAHKISRFLKEELGANTEARRGLPRRTFRE